MFRNCQLLRFVCSFVRAKYSCGLLSKRFSTNKTSAPNFKSKKGNQSTNFRSIPNILLQLTKEQKSAVLETEKTCIVIAGPVLFVIISLFVL